MIFIRARKNVLLLQAFGWQNGHHRQLRNLLLVTVTTDRFVNKIVGTMRTLSVHEVGDVRKFLSMLLELEDSSGYNIDQQVAIEDLLVKRGLAEPERAPSPVGDE